MNLEDPSVLMDDSTAFQAAHHQVSCDLGGESVVLDLNASLYYGLNAVGATVWNLLLQRPTTLAALQAAVLQDYDVAPAVCRADLERLLRQLLDKGLVTITYEEAG